MMSERTLTKRDRGAVALLLALLMLGTGLASAPAANAHGGCPDSRFCGHSAADWLGGARVENGDDSTWVDDGFNDVASSASNHESVDVNLYTAINWQGTRECIAAGYNRPQLVHNDQHSSVDYDNGSC